MLDPVVPVALAALGVLVGLSVGDRRTDDRRVLAAACLYAALTMLVVSAGIAVVALAATSSVVRPFWTLVVAGGICAASSLTLPTGNPLEPRTAATRVIELGVLLPIVVGGLVLAWLRAGSFVGAVTLVAQASIVTLALAASAWLVLTRASPETEERVLAVSALSRRRRRGRPFPVRAVRRTGRWCVLAVCGTAPARDDQSRCALCAAPLLVLVLLVAGARADLSAASLGLGAAYLALRVVGQLAGGIVARRVAGVNMPRDLGRYLLPPGVFGVAFALNAASVVGADASVLLAAVVAGTIGSEFVALLLPPRRVDA